jgi:hypothetical protein
MSAPDTDQFAILAGNDPHCDGWRKGSFVERLTEDAQFDGEAYERLEGALISVAAEGPSVETFGLVLRVFEQITLLIRWHFDQNEGYRIENLEIEQLVEFDKRFRFLIIELSFGNSPDMTQWGSARYELTDPGVK